MGVIYKIINSVNNKIYIGQTSNRYPNTRWSAHKLNAKNNKKHPLYNTIKKYGIGNFTFIIIEKDILSNDLNKKEVKYIKLYNSIFPKGYNLTEGGESKRGKNNGMYGKNPWNKGVPRTKEEKIKMSESQKGKKGLSGKDNRMYGKKPWNKGKKKTNEERHIDRLRQKNRISINMYKNSKLIKHFISLGESAEWIRNNTTIIINFNIIKYEKYKLQPMWTWTRRESIV